MLRRYREARPVELCIPGHRGGRHADAEVLDFLGGGAFAADVTQVEDIDDLLAPRGAIAEAQAMAADTWGARRTWFLTNGTSSGIQAAMLATCREGDVVVASRASHRSVLEGMILTGAVPRWVACGVDDIYGCALPPTEAAWERASAPGARLLVTTRPTYFGDAASLSLIAFARACGTILLVDEAWGAHLGFHPETPSSACRAGADIVVNSTHKTVSALSGGAMLHLCSDRVETERVAGAIGLVTTTSPYYGVLASLDGARRQMATGGHDRVARWLSIARAARDELRTVEGLRVAGVERAGRVPGVDAYDETRLVVSATGMGWTGYDLEAWLRTRYRVRVELAEARSVVALAAGAGDAEPVRCLVAGLLELPARAGPASRPVPTLPPPDVVMTPREAFQAARTSIPMEHAVGRICAEVICPYPPGIPALSPGERVTRELLDTLGEVLAAGGRLQGCADPTLRTVRVVA